MPIAFTGRQTAVRPPLLYAMAIIQNTFPSWNQLREIYNATRSFRLPHRHTRVAPRTNPSIHPSTHKQTTISAHYSFRWRRYWKLTFDSPISCFLLLFYCVAMQFRAHHTVTLHLCVAVAAALHLRKCRRVENASEKSKQTTTVSMSKKKRDCFLFLSFFFCSSCIFCCSIAFVRLIAIILYILLIYVCMASCGANINWLCIGE